MKKIYTLLLAFILGGFATQSQTLTKAANEPVVGNVQKTTEFDSVSTIPKTIGQNKSWNFSDLLQTSAVLSSTFVPTNSVPTASAYLGATLAEELADGSWNIYKSSSTQIELLGSTDGTTNLVFTNSMTYMTWPFSYGNSFTDIFTGSINSGTFSANLTGTNTTNASGTGTITLPGGQVLTNVLQLKLTQKMLVQITNPFPITITSFINGYSYFHSSQKFPLLSVSYQYNQNALLGNDSSATISLNNAVVLGLTDKNFEATFQIFPNPAVNDFNVELSNTSASNCNLTIYSGQGALIKSIDMGNSHFIKEKVDISELASGIYIVRTLLGDRISSRRLIIE